MSYTILYYTIDCPSRTSMQKAGRRAARISSSPYSIHISIGLTPRGVTPWCVYSLGGLEGSKTPLRVGASSLAALGFLSRKLSFISLLSSLFLLVGWRFLQRKSCSDF